MQNPTFESLGLSKNALDAVSRLRYESPTPIQSDAIPEILAGHDVIAAAETGTGKTAAFLLPLLDKLKPEKKKGRSPRILVISPTRELAEQIARISYTISRSCGLFATCLFGGQPYGPQIKALRAGCDVVVATPGRLCDLMDKGAIDLSRIQYLVLDEADRMLDMGFLPDVKKIVSAIPDKRQTLLFSATIDDGIKNNFTTLLNDPKTIKTVSRGQTSELVDQYILPVSQKEKSELLKCLLDEKGHDKVIVFARTKTKVEGVTAMLEKAGFDVARIHSDRTQGQRKAALSSFRKGNAGVLVATDVLARGIDIPEVEYVVNYDLPDMAEDYIHRIGRTGRAGNIGFAVSFVSGNSLKSLESIEKLLGKDLPIMRIDSFDVDMQILKRKSRTGRPKKPSGKAIGKKGANTRYNYDGWGDKRTGSKRKKAPFRDSAKNGPSKSKGEAKRAQKAAKPGSTNRRPAKQGSAKPKRSSMRPGMRSSGLSRGRRK